MAKYLVIQGSDMAVMPLTSATVRAVDGPSPRQRGGGGPAPRSSFTGRVGALCLAGLAVAILGLLLAPLDTLSTPASRNNPEPELWLLQPLITGNLTILLFWVWLDRLWAASGSAVWAARFGLWLVAVLVAFASSVLSLMLSGVLTEPDIVPLTLCFALPTVTLVTAASWLAVQRIPSLALRTLILTGFILASAHAQRSQRLDLDGEPGLGFFARNSCLIGLAVLVWLVAWAAAPYPQRTA